MRDALRRGAIGDAIGHEDVWLSELSAARAASDSFSRDIRYDGDKWIRYSQLPNCRVSRVMFLAQPLFIWLATGHHAPCQAVLAESAAGPALG